MRIKFLPLFILILSVSALAQSPSKILKQAEKALGGAKAMQAVGSWTKTGKITRLRDGASGRFQMHTTAPNLYHVSYDLDGFETEAGYSGRSGWTRDSRQGLSTLTGDASRDFQAEAVFHNGLWLNYKKDKSKIAPAGRGEVNGRAANILILTTLKGVSIRLYFDTATGQLLREEIPSGTGVKTFDYSDYRMVGAINQPYSIMYKAGEDTYRINLDDIRANASISKTTFDFPNRSGDSLPDIPELLADLRANEDRIEKILDKYSFTEKYITREVGKDGALREVESVTFQFSFYKGNRMRRMIEKNGKPLNEKEQAEEDKKAAERVEDMEKEVAKKEAKGNADDEDGKRVSIAELLRASNLINPRRERFRGRDVVVFDFEPNPLFDYKNAKSMLKFFGKTTGVMWIDEQDKQVARLEAVLADSFNIGGGMLAKLRKGASFTIERDRINNEIWLPSQTDINLSVRVLMVKGINVNQLIKAYDYRKFETEVKDAKVNETPKP
jgi:hypothetical protein